MQSTSQIIATNKPTSSFLQAGCPSWRPTNSVKALKGKISHFVDLFTPSSAGGLPTLSLSSITLVFTKTTCWHQPYQHVRKQYETKLPKLTLTATNLIANQPSATVIFTTRKPIQKTLQVHFIKCGETNRKLTPTTAHC